MYGTGATPVMPRRGNLNPNAQARAALETPTPFERSFTIQDVGALGLKVMLDNGTDGVIAPDKACKIDVTGTADPAFLKSGLLVKFNAQLDKKGRATAPLNELEIVTMQTASDKDGDFEKGTAKKPTTSALGPGIVLGHVTEYKNNELTVQTTDGQQVKAELGANPAIKVHVSEFRGYAQPGDKVDVKGYFVPAQPSKAMAREMKITLSSPLGSDPSKKKPQAKSTSTTASK